MKGFLTRFNWDGHEHIGPIIFANNLEEAKVVAEYYNLELDGEIEDIDKVSSNLMSRVLH